jgi:hypothetical protein
LLLTIGGETEVLLAGDMRMRNRRRDVVTGVAGVRVKRPNALS